jgi:hypothetical protein
VVRIAFFYQLIKPDDHGAELRRTLQLFKGLVDEITAAEYIRMSGFDSLIGISGCMAFNFL